MIQWPRTKRMKKIRRRRNDGKNLPEFVKGLNFALGIHTYTCTQSGTIANGLFFVADIAVILYIFHRH